MRGPLLHPGDDLSLPIIATMTTQTDRPDAIRIQLGRTLRRPAADSRPIPSGWTRIALRGMATGLLLGLVVGTALTPSIAGVLVTGGATLAYALLTFGTERPEA